MNTVSLIGNLTKDPEMRDAAGTPVVTLRIAVNGRKKQGEDWIDTPNYFDVTVWGRQAELAVEHLARGRQIAVEGRLEWREWEAEDGTKRQAVQVVARDLDYLAKPQGDAERHAARNVPVSEGGLAPEPVGVSEGSPDGSHDDIPY